jgi:hypothetical protein
MTENFRVKFRQTQMRVAYLQELGNMIQFLGQLAEIRTLSGLPFGAGCHGWGWG